MADGPSPQGLRVNGNVPTLFLLYFLQGLPYGFQVKLLPLLLRQNDFSLTRISFTRLLSLPWVFKFTAAPFVDRTAFLHRWICASLAGMSALYFFSAVTGSSDAFILLCCVFGLNVFSATQDVAVDGLAMQLLKSEDLGKGNMAQVVGYKFGALFGGGIFAWLAVFTPWNTLFGLMGCLYLVLSVLLFAHLRNIQRVSWKDKKCTIKKATEFPFPGINTKTCLDKPELVQRSHTNHEQGDQWSRKHVQDRGQSKDSESGSIAAMASHEESVQQQFGWFDVFNSVLHSPGFLWLLVYVLTYKLGEQGAVSMFPLFLLDQGFSKENVGFISGVCGQVFSIGGSAFGGWLISWHSCNRACLIKTLLWTSLPRSLALASQWIQVLNLTQTSLLLAMASESILQFTAGVVTTATFTLMMSLSQEMAPGAQATHFSILATAEVVGKLLMISLSGILVDWMGYCAFFGLCWTLALAVLPVLYEARQLHY